MFNRFTYFPFYLPDDGSHGGENDSPNKNSPQTDDIKNDNNSNNHNENKPPKPNISFTKEQQEYIDRIFNERFAKQRRKWEEEQKMTAEELAKRRFEEEKAALEEEKQKLEKEKREYKAKKLLAEKNINEKWLSKIDLNNEDIEGQVNDIVTLIAEVRDEEAKRWNQGYVPEKGNSNGTKTLSNAAQLAKNLSQSGKKTVKAFD